MSIPRVTSDHRTAWFDDNIETGLKVKGKPKSKGPSIPGKSDVGNSQPWRGAGGRLQQQGSSASKKGSKSEAARHRAATVASAISWPKPQRTCPLRLGFSATRHLPPCQAHRAVGQVLSLGQQLPLTRQG